MVLVAGGHLFSQCGAVQSRDRDLHFYRQPEHRARYHTATLLNNGMVLVAGGYNTQYHVALASAELYNPATGTFTPTGSLNTARYCHTATLLNNGMVLIAGGGLHGTLASAELYNPATGTFTLTGSLNTARGRPHGDAAEQRHGADGGRLQQLQRCLIQCGAVQSRHRDLHFYRQPEHRALLAHGDAAEQRHGADGGRLATAASP